MHAAAVRFALRVPGSRSLKAKRAVLRPVVDGLRARYRVSVAEVGHHDAWQLAAIGVAAVASSEGHLREVLAAVERHVVAAADVELLDAEWAWLDPDEPTLADGDRSDDLDDVSDLADLEGAW